MRIQTLFQNIKQYLKGKAKTRATLFSGDYKQAVLIREGRKQFKALLSKGITVPVALL